MVLLAQVLDFVHKFYQLNGVSLTSEHIFLDLLNNILALVTSKADAEVKSVDLRVAALRALQSLIEKSDLKTLEKLFAEKQKLVMSHLIFSCLEWIEKEKRSKNLIDEAIKTMLNLSVRGTNGGENLLDLFHAMFLQMLPGKKQAQK